MEAEKLGGKSGGPIRRDSKGRDGGDLNRTCCVDMHILKQKGLHILKEKHKRKFPSRKQLNRNQICTKYNVFLKIFLLIRSNGKSL